MTLAQERKMCSVPVKYAIVSDKKRLIAPNTKIHVVTYSQPGSVARRNARERNRVKQVNNGFATLRSHLPEDVFAAQKINRGTGKKLSKVETLRMAVEYIRSLKKMIEDHDPEKFPGERLAASEASVSPTPSYSSEGSSSVPAFSVPQFYCRENFGEKSVADDELLDAIFYWQQSD